MVEGSSMYTDVCSQMFTQRQVKAVLANGSHSVIRCVLSCVRSGVALMQLEEGWYAFLFVKHLVKYQKFLGNDEGAIGYYTLVEGAWMISLLRVYFPS